LEDESVAGVTKKVAVCGRFEGQSFHQETIPVEMLEFVDRWFARAVSMHDVQSALERNDRIQLTQPDESSNSIFQETGFLACSSSRIPYRIES
jgi:hypothetical protein